MSKSNKKENIKEVVEKKETKKVNLVKQETVEKDGEKVIKVTYSDGREQYFGL